jgi:hypothetical protein
MRIQKQIGIGFLGVVAVSGLATTIAFTGQAFMRRSSEALSAESTLQASAALLERAVAKLGEGASIVARSEDPMGHQVVAEGRAELTVSLASLEELTLDSSMAAELDELKALAGSVAAANAGVISIAERPDDAEGASRSTQHLDRTLDALETRRRALILKVQVFADHARSRAQAAQITVQRLWSQATVGIVGLFVAALGLTWGSTALAADTTVAPGTDGRCSHPGTVTNAPAAARSPARATSMASKSRRLMENAVAVWSGLRCFMLHVHGM